MTERAVTEPAVTGRAVTEPAVTEQAVTEPAAPCDRAERRCMLPGNAGEG